MAKQRITEAQAAAAMYPNHAPTKGTKANWSQRQMEMSGLRRRDPKSDRDRSFVSPLGWQAVRQPVKGSKT
jgi:hypothetical protein